MVLTGPSGGGKTTLTRLLNGLAPAYYTGSMEGHIFFDDTPLETLHNMPLAAGWAAYSRIPKASSFLQSLPARWPLPVRITGWPGRRSAAGPMPPSKLFPWSICGVAVWMYSPAEKNSGWRLLRLCAAPRRLCLRRANRQPGRRGVRAAG